MLGGFGSIDAFNKKIRENRALLRKSSRFDRTDNLLGKRDEFLKDGDNKKIDFIHPDETTLAQIKNTIHLKFLKKEKKRHWLSLVIILFTTLFFIPLFFVFFKENIPNADADFQRNKGAYEDLNKSISFSNQWKSKGHWKNALYFLNEASSKHPGNLKLSLQYLDVYTQACKLDQVYCMEATAGLQAISKFSYPVY